MLIQALKYGVIIAISAAVVWILFTIWMQIRIDRREAAEYGHILDE